MEKKIEEKNELSQYVVRGASISCSMGTCPDVLNIPFSHGVFLSGKAQLNVADCKGGTNILCFGNCLRSNPPPVCTPTFSPGSKWINHEDTHLKIEKEKALIKDATLQCIYAGKISINTCGQ